MAINHYKVNMSKYFDVEAMLKHYGIKQCDKVMVIADNGCGKTYSATNLVMKYLALGRTCAWIRNTELESIKCVEGLKAGLTRFGMQDKYTVNTQGIYLITEWTKFGTVKNGKLVCPIVYLSSLARSVPQEIKASLIVIDEFIDGNDKNKFVMPNYNASLKKAINRLTRPVKDNVITIMLANAHNGAQHDLIYAMCDENDFDWDKLALGETDYVYNAKRKFVGIVIPKQFSIKEMNKTYEYWEGKDGVKENYTFLSNKYKTILPNQQNNAEMFIKITYRGGVFAIGNINVNDKPYLYAYECKNVAEYDNLPNYAVMPTDKEIYNEYIVDRFTRLNKIAPIVNANLSNRLYCSTDFTYETLKSLNTLILPMELENLNTHF